MHQDLIYLESSIDKLFLTDASSFEEHMYSPNTKSYASCANDFSELFDKSGSLVEHIFYRMFHTYIDLVIKRNESRSIFIKSEENVFKHFNKFDKKILDIYNEFVYDVKSRMPQFDCNLIGGKIADFFDCKTVETTEGDYDIWLGPDVFFGDVYNALSKNKKYKFIVETGRFYEYETTYLDKPVKFQIIKQSFDSFESILNGFDFLHCSVGYDGNCFFWKKGALKSIKRKEMFVNRIAPTRVLNERIQKYILRGYSLSFPTFTLLSISSILGLMSVEIQEKLFFKYQAEYPALFEELRGASGGYSTDQF